MAATTTAPTAPTSQAPGETAPHVFLSYSRKDSEMASRLNDALKTSGRNTWLDLEGIPLSAEWLAEINRAIDGAQACVFLLSPDWVSSEICLAELRHAVEGNKRLIPMLHREAGKEVPQELADLNWLFCREEDDFAAAVEALLETLDTDLDHVRVHTRLLVRAHEWEARLRERSRLLRGKDLREALGWLGSSGDKEPLPTPLHREYVERSRATAVRRRRLFLSGLAAAVVLALAGTFIGVRNNQRSAAVATARQGQALVASRPAEGLLYAIQAVGTTTLDASVARALRAVGRGGSAPSVAPEVRSSLFAAVQTLATGALERDVFDAPGADPVQSIAFSRDGKTIVSGSDNGTVQIWDLDGNLVGEPFQATRQAGSQVFSVDVSRDGETIVSGGLDYVARVWTRGVEGRFEPAAAVGANHIVRAVAFSPVDEGLVAIGNNSGNLFLWHWRDDLRIAAKGRAGGELGSVAFDPDGRLLVGATSPPRPARFWDLEGNEVAASWLLGNGSEAPVPMTEAMAAAFGPDGRTLVTGGGRDGVARVWSRGGDDELVWQLAAEGRGHEGLVTTVAFSPDGESFLTGAVDGTVRHWDLEGRPLRLPFRGHEQRVNAIALGPDGKTVVSTGWSGNMRLWQLTDDPPGRVVGRHGDAAPADAPSFDPEVYRKVLAVAISADGGRIVSGGHDAFVRVWDRQGKMLGEAPDRALGVPKSYSGQLRVASVGISADGETIVSGGWDQRVRRWDTATGALDEGRVLDDTFGQVRTVGISADGRTIVSGGQLTSKLPNGARLWRDGERIELEELGAPSSPYVVVSGDGRTIVSTTVVDDPGPILVWKEPWGAPIVLEGSDEGVRTNAVAVSADGRTIASADQAGFVQIWDGGGARLAGPLTGHRGSVYSVAVSADGETVVSGSGDATLRLWDRRGNPIGDPLVGHESLPWSVAISANGESLVSGSWDGTVRLWPLGEMEDWMARACEWVRTYDGTEQMRPEVEKAREVCAVRTPLY